MTRGRLTGLLFTEAALLALLGGLASAAVVALGGRWVRGVLLGAMTVEAVGMTGRC